ncbi:hypothetical protein ECE37_17410, partial [Acinetobacter baumannii]|nr:hypothetical protein [Acinetobacter baumannii]
MPQRTERKRSSIEFERSENQGQFFIPWAFNYFKRMEEETSGPQSRPAHPFGGLCLEKKNTCTQPHIHNCDLAFHREVR